MTTHMQSHQIDPEQALKIIEDLDASQVGLVFAGDALRDLHEPLIMVLQSDRWRSRYWNDERIAFLDSMRAYSGCGDNYRRLFAAMCESGSTQGVLRMIHATGRKDRCMTGNQPLITMGSLVALIRTNPKAIEPVIHFLSRAAVSTMAEEPKALMQALRKQFQPLSIFSGRWLEAIHLQAKSRSTEALGLKGDMSAPAYWLKEMVCSATPRDNQIASAIVAGCLARGSLKLEDIQRIDLDDVQKVRIVKSLGLDPHKMDFSRVVSSASKHISPSYQL